MTLPAAVRTLAVDPSDPGGGAFLLSASHVVLPSNNQVRGINLVRDASGRRCWWTTTSTAGCRAARRWA